MGTTIQEARFAALRRNMVEQHLRLRGIRDQRVLEAMARVPRHEFILPEYRGQAYEDHPLPIGEGQTVSQPFIVALMLEALALQSSDRVLEVGTGSGYQTALLAELTQRVYSVERFASLAEEASSTLARRGYVNVSVSVGDGSHGLPARAPFDAIVVSAAAPSVPTPLFEQLGEAGRMVIPVGDRLDQELLVITKSGGKIHERAATFCRFVPLRGDRGWQ